MTTKVRVSCSSTFCLNAKHTWIRKNTECFAVYVCFSVLAVEYGTKEGKMKHRNSETEEAATTAIEYDIK